MITRLPLFLILLLGLLTQAPNLFASPPLSIQTQLSEYIKAPQHQQDQLALLEKLVNINSGTNNIQGVQKVGELLRPQFEELGFKTFWVEEPPSMHRAATLVAERTGHKGKRILLIGHLDTVFPANSPFQHFERHGNIAKGPGVVDDKGGDVVILYALKALQASHALDDATIRVVLTGDEEESGKPTSISRKPLIEIAKQSDIAIDFELAPNQDTATTARRGIANWVITAQGNEAHSSLIFKRPTGFGAIFELARILNTRRADLSTEHYLTFNPGLVLGGTTLNYHKNDAQGMASGKENVIAKTAIVSGDLRFISEEQKKTAINKIQVIVKQHLPETSATITFEDGIPSMPPTEGNLQLLKEYSKVSEALGYGPVKPIDPGLRGAGDISHIAAFVSANLSGLGPIGTDTHSIKETLDIPSLTMQTERTALFIYRLIS